MAPLHRFKERTFQVPTIGLMLGSLMCVACHLFLRTVASVVGGGPEKGLPSVFLQVLQTGIKDGGANVLFHLCRRLVEFHAVDVYFFRLSCLDWVDNANIIP